MLCWRNICKLHEWSSSPLYCFSRCQISVSRPRQCRLSRWDPNLWITGAPQMRTRGATLIQSSFCPCPSPNPSVLLMSFVLSISLISQLREYCQLVNLSLSSSVCVLSGSLHSWVVAVSVSAVEWELTSDRVAIWDPATGSSFSPTPLCLWLIVLDEEENRPPFASSLIGFCWRGYNRHGVQDRVESLPFLFLPLKILSASASSRSLLPNPSF